MTTKLSRDCHAVRYVSPSRLLRDDRLNIIGVRADAFALRPVDAGRLSTTWMEFFLGERSECMESAVKCMRESNIEVKKNSGFAIANVGNVTEFCKANSYKVRFLHEPVDDNAAHASVHRWPASDLVLMEKIAAEIWCEVVANTDISEA